MMTRPPDPFLGWSRRPHGARVWLCQVGGETVEECRRRLLSYAAWIGGDHDLAVMKQESPTGPPPQETAPIGGVMIFRGGVLRGRRAEVPA
jgi:hypothetical protein